MAKERTAKAATKTAGAKAPPKVTKVPQKAPTPKPKVYEYRSAFQGGRFNEAAARLVARGFERCKDAPESCGQPQGSIVFRREVQS